jgi:uncharacterized membrane protein (DUF485 family)
MSDPDWDGIAESRDFRDLQDSRRRFLVPSIAFFSAYFVVFLCLLGWAPDAMSEQVLGNISVALILGASIVFLTFVMAWLYTRKSAEWGEMAERIRAANTAYRASADGGAR